MQLDLPSIAQVYDRYAALKKLSSQLGGWLLLYTELNSRGLALAIAANTAGAASLGLESERERGKQALRHGVCDFLVNDLDEALRILKNELRKQRPVSVVLACDPQATVDQSIERGVQPDIVAFPEATLQLRGARLLPTEAGAESGLQSVRWSVAQEAARWLPILDRAAAMALAEPAADRRHWLAASPRYLGRSFAGQRYLRMASAEADVFQREVERLVSDKEIPVAVILKRDETEKHSKP
jgi:hypothetical protein